MHKWWLFAAFGVTAGVSLQCAAAQEEANVSKTGYVTEVRGPHEFALNKQFVETDDATSYRPMDKKAAKAGDVGVLAKEAVRVGAYLEVQGKRESKGHAVKASLVLVRDDLGKELGGSGIIEKVVEAGAEPVVQADGYKIRVTSGTELSFGDGMESVSDAVPGCFIRYKGTRNADGVLVARQARIVRPKTMRFATIRHAQGEKAARQQPVPEEGGLIDINGNLLHVGSKVDIRDGGGPCGWHRVTADAALQERVLQVGQRILPAYQKELAEDDAAKIHFRFYAVEEKAIRSELDCIPGLILVPRQVVERLENDDQLAALLADGVAYNLQLQTNAFFDKEMVLAATGVGVAEASLRSAPGIAAGGLLLAHEMEKPLAEERGRIALELMADGGYDPWQAPEAWRLLAEKKPKPGSQPAYPDRSGYQLSILNLQYREKSAGASAAAPSPF